MSHRGNDPMGIIDAYRQGNLNTRIDLYLGYREWREEFDRIERQQDAAQRETTVEAAGKESSPAGKPTGSLFRLLRWCYSIMA